jgi:hypothetical protein
MLIFLNLNDLFIRWHCIVEDNLLVVKEVEEASKQVAYQQMPHHWGNTHLWSLSSPLYQDSQ